MITRVNSPRLVDIAAVLKRHLLFIVLATVLGMILTTAAILALRPTYTAAAAVALDSRQNKAEEMQSVTSRLVSGLPTDEVVVRTEQDFLKAEPLLDRVAAELDLASLPEFQTRPSLLSTMLTAITERLRFEADQETPPSPADPTARAVQALRRHLDVGSEPGSYVIKVSYTGYDPALAARIVNKIVDLYLSGQQGGKTADARRVADWLAARVAEAQRKLQASEQKVKDFEQANNLGEARGLTTLSQQIYDVNTELVAAAAAREQADAALAQAESGDASHAPIVTSPLLQKLREQEAVVARREAELSTRYLDSYPALVEARASLKDTRAKIDAETRRIIGSLGADARAAHAKEDSLQRRLADLQRQRGAASSAEAGLQQLQADAAANRSLYIGLLNQYRTVAAQESVQRPDVRLLASAKPPLLPSGPPRKLLLACALVFWSSSSMLWVLFSDRSRRSYASAQALESEEAVRVLGMTLEAKGGGAAAVDAVVDEPTGMYSEALRAVSGAIEREAGAAQGRTILVTSSVPEEGKSVLAVSLARQIALSGARTLLVDADLRHPSVGRHLASSPGQRELGASQEIDGVRGRLMKDDRTGLDYIIHERDPDSADMGRLLSAAGFGRLLRGARQGYRYVVVDAPPLLAVSDALRLVDFVDAVLLAVRWERTPKSIVAHAVKALRDNGVSSVSAVLSRVDLRKHKRYSYGDSVYVMSRNRGRYLQKASQ